MPFLCHRKCFFCIICDVKCALSQGRAAVPLSQAVTSACPRFTPLRIPFFLLPGLALLQLRSQSKDNLPALASAPHPHPPPSPSIAKELETPAPTELVKEAASLLPFAIAAYTVSSARTVPSGCSVSTAHLTAASGAVPCSKWSHRDGGGVACSCLLRAVHMAIMWRRICDPWYGRCCWI